MKRLREVLVLCVVAFAFATAGDNERGRVLSTGMLERIEQNLVMALQSDCPGLQTSAAVTLLQVRKLAPAYGWTDAVIPLMRIVNGEQYHPDARLAAALALHELRSDRGDFSIAQNARFTSDPRMKRLCILLAADRRHPGQNPGR